MSRIRIDSVEGLASSQHTTTADSGGSKRPSIVFAATYIAISMIANEDDDQPDSNK
jgi:hypothetical protein